MRGQVGGRVRVACMHGHSTRPACCPIRQAIINALLAVAAVTLIGSLGLGLGGGGQAGGWSGTTYASYVLVSAPAKR